MSEQSAPVIDIQGIMQLIPHRYPFLLVDRILNMVPGESITGMKNVTMNEPFFQGHFPGLPVMPGVLILEAMAQAGAILLSKTNGVSLEGKIFMFTGIDKVRFRNPVVPGDQVMLKCSDVRNKLALWKMKSVAEVDGKVVVEAMVTAAIIDRDEV